MNIIAKPAKLAKAKATRIEQRLSRFELLSINRHICVKEGEKLGLEYPHDFHRSAKCCHVRISDLHVLQEKTSGNAFYAGLMQCGNVWTCPHCAAKIERKRAAEIDVAMGWAYKETTDNEQRGATAKRVNGTQAMMLTFTFPHARTDRLDDLLSRFNAALRSMRSGKAWQKFRKAVGYRGLIRATEITLGKNGWHPHTHEIWFVDQGITADEVKSRILHRWINELIKHGFINADDSKAIANAMRRALDVKAEVHSGEYLQKISRELEVITPESMGISKTRGNHELARASTKIGKSKGIAPFQILRKAGEGSAYYWERWLEYMAATKGKSRLFWSSGLKELVGLNQDKTDEQLATEQTEEADILGLIECSEWGLIRKSGADKAGVLSAAETGGWTAVRAYIDRLKEADKAWIAQVGAGIENQNPKPS